MPNRKEFFKVMPPVGLPGFGLRMAVLRIASEIHDKVGETGDRTGFL